MAASAERARAAQVQTAFGLAKAYKAERLRQRAVDMSQRGFEWTLLHGEPRNPAAHRYPLLPPCCDFEMMGMKGKCRSKDIQCAPSRSQHSAMQLSLVMEIARCSQIKLLLRSARSRHQFVGQVVSCL
jgi:hypothetical protein